MIISYAKFVMRIFPYRLFILFATIFIPSCLQCTQIDLLQSDIQVTPSGKFFVKTEITYRETEKHKHGIFFHMPVEYTEVLWTNYTTPLDITNISRDGVQVPYTKSHYDGHIHLQIGSKDTYLNPGIYQYTICYTTARQIQFHNDYDEFAWNIAGNDSSIPIKKCIATIHLPKNINPTSLQYSVFTGLYGAKTSHALIELINPTTLHIQTTAPLEPHEGLTIYSSWNKGVITRPTKIKQLCDFIRDNPGLLFFYLGFIAIFLFWRRKRRELLQSEEPTTIIPRFYPPETLTPLTCGYIKSRIVKPDHLAAEIIHLAIQGFLTIENPKDHPSIYVLTKKKDFLSKNSDEISKHIMQRLFFKQDKLILEKPKTNESNLQLISLLKTLETKVKHLPVALYLKLHTTYIFPPALTLGLNLAIASLLDGYISPLTLLPSVFFFIRMLMYLPGYTVEGRKVVNEIDGFALYLKTAELDRWRIIGTPPIKTPELFERYLPFAMVLGLEKAWTDQFVPYFKQWEQAGHAYHPHWFIGPRLNAHMFRNFSSVYAQASHPPTYASAKVPTGRFGGGSAGGGRGGGGFGSW